MDQPSPNQPVSTITPPPVPTPSAPSPTQSAESKERSSMYLWVVISLVVLAAAGAAIYYMGKHTSITPAALTASPSVVVTAVAPTSSARGGGNSQIPEPKKPDLVIEKITYKQARTPKDSQGMSAIGPGNLLEFTITVKNSGGAPFMDSAYVSNSRSQEDFTLHRSTHTELVNQSKETVPAGTSRDFVVTDNVDTEATKVRFAVNFQDTGDKKGSGIEVRDEADYTNNSYELEIK